MSQPDTLTGNGRVNGLGDINFSAFFSPLGSGALTWGVGPALIVPTETDKELGPDRWSGDLAAIALAMPGNWEAESGEQWTVPIGGGVGKIMKWGKLPVNGQISAYNNIESPVNGADWQFRIQLQFLFPK